MSFLQSFWRRVGHGLLVVAAVAALVLSPQAVRADNFNGGAYGSDVYGSGTTPGGNTDPGSSSGSNSGSSGSSSGGSTSTPASSTDGYDSTVIETPSGLEVAINLSDGQTIPADGYYITVTPINGQGKTFDKVEIYLDGVLAYTGQPDETGTLRWLWDTANKPAQKVKIVVFGPGEGTTTHEFNVKVTPKATDSTSTPSSNTTSPDESPSTDGGWPLWLIILAILFGVLLLILIIWLIVRRRRRDDNIPPPSTTFGPLQ